MLFWLISNARHGYLFRAGQLLAALPLVLLKEARHWSSQVQLCEHLGVPKQQRRASNGHGLPLTTQHTAAGAVQTPVPIPCRMDFLASVLPTERAPLLSTTPRNPGHWTPGNLAGDRAPNIATFAQSDCSVQWVMGYRTWQCIQKQRRQKQHEHSAVQEQHLDGEWHSMKIASKFQCNGE